MRSSSTKDLIKAQKQLICIDHTNLTCHPCIGKRCCSRLIKIIDGDTLSILVLHEKIPMKFSLRLHGIDAPESSLRKGVSPLEKEAGQSVKVHVKNILCNREFFFVDVISIDKYGGRYIGHFYIDDDCKMSLSAHLLSAKLVKPYDGKKKSAWRESELHQINEYVLKSQK